LLTQLPGISAYFCGSAVTYREETKSSWLDVSSEVIASNTAESQATTDAMAVGALNKTPEATHAAAITGHLGPGAEGPIDGVIFLAIAKRHQNGTAISKSESHKLTSDDRSARQLEAAEFLLKTLLSELGS
jgi:PncC family amidohydrolase